MTVLWPGPAPLSAARQADLFARLEPQFAAKAEELGIGHDAMAMQRVYLPLAGWVAKCRAGKPLRLGIAGPQGTGKSTLCEWLRLVLQQGFGLRVAALSLDDLYKTRTERQHLSQAVHPLLATRGVPGTHDVELGLNVIGALGIAQEGDSVAMPSFDKAVDDRRPLQVWPRFAGPAHVVIFEGWCVAAQPQADAALVDPINDLERNEDADGTWRRYVNGQLGGAYAALFAQVDALVLLKAPSMEKVIEWRGLQERKLAARVGADGGHRLMNASAIQRFVQHYERITRHMQEEMPGRADVILFVNEEHQIGRIQLKD